MDHCRFVQRLTYFWQVSAKAVCSDCMQCLSVNTNCSSWSAQSPLRYVCLVCAEYQYFQKLRI